MDEKKRQQDQQQAQEARQASPENELMGEAITTNFNTEDSMRPGDPEEK